MKKENQPCVAVSPVEQGDQDDQQKRGDLGDEDGDEDDGEDKEDDDEVMAYQLLGVLLFVRDGRVGADH